MSPITTQSGIFQTRVASNRVVCREHFEITLAVEGFPAAAPGQFIQVLCHEPDAFCASTEDSEAMIWSTDACPERPMLRRPFSIGGLRRTGQSTEIDIMGRVVGVGTAWLADLKAGEEVDILGPLGGAFVAPSVGESALLVAGGVGLPPIRWLGELLALGGVACRAIVGAQSEALVPLRITQPPENPAEFDYIADEFSRIKIPALITTDDGSFGLKGRVTDALKTLLDKACAPDVGVIRVYACGPEPMLKAVSEMCDECGVSCQVAMERVMGCGVGTCQSCVVPIKDAAAPDGWRYALCCREGPVFNSRVVLW